MIYLTIIGYLVFGFVLAKIVGHYIIVKPRNETDTLIVGFIPLIWPLMIVIVIIAGMFYTVEKALRWLGNNL